MIDITRNAIWTNDCQGKQDLDFSIISADTRYWPDLSAKCTLLFLDDFNYNTNEYEYGIHPPIVIAESDFITGATEEEVKLNVRKWYNEHIVSAMEEVIKLLNE